MDLSLKDCPGCGGVVLPDATSCPSCGHALVPDVVEEAPKPVVRDLSPRVQAASPSNRVGNSSPPRPAAVTPHRLADDDDDDGDFSSDVELVDDIQLLEDMNIGDEMGQVAEGTADDYQEDGGDDFDLAPGIESVTMESSLAPGYDQGYQDDYQYDQAQTYDQYPAEGGAEGAGELPYDPAAAPGQYDQGQYDQSQQYDAGAEGTYNYAETPPADAPPAEGYAQEGALPEGEVPAASAEAPPAVPPGPVQATEDVLLAHAIAEESESGQRQSIKRKKGPTATPGLTLFVYCPHGHRVLVKETHRGRIGKCPNCKEPFFVPKTPLAPPKPKEKKEESAAQAPVAFTASSKYAQWIRDAHLHRVHPSKLKLTEGSLVGEYDTVDLTFCSEHVLVATVFAGGGAFRSMQEAKKKPAFRQSLLEHLSTGRPFSELAGFRHDLISAEQLSALKVVQPALPGEDSLFADVLVFGPGRIAVRTPSADAGGDRAYLSFTLSQFRDFVLYLGDVLNFPGFGADRGIPLTDEFTESSCHYSDRKLQGLTRLEYYKADPSFQLEVQGWKCQSCGMTISEDSRKKEKIGGKSESSIAKAKCPKCKNKFGEQPLYGLKSAAEAT